MIAQQEHTALLGALALCGLDVLGEERFTGPWDVVALQEVPRHEWAMETNGVRGVYYSGLPYQGRATRVFAWLGIPLEGQSTEVPERSVASPGFPPSGSPPTIPPVGGTPNESPRTGLREVAGVPGMILLHGGGQHVSPLWVSYWVDRGYAAIAMDLDGYGPDGLLPDAGPRFQFKPFFGPFPSDDLREGWIYHAVANVMRAHSLLTAQPGVAADRIGLNGLSLGGSLVCLVAGVDARVRAAAPVYGAGFFDEGGYWQGHTQSMDCRRAREWEALLDPGAYLPGITCPVLFQNGATDPFTPPDTYQRNVDACGGTPTLAMRDHLDHGDFWRWPWGENEVNLFLDHHLRDGPPPPTIRVVEEAEDHVVCTVTSSQPVVRVDLVHTTDLGAWQSRSWQHTTLEVDPAHFTAVLPEGRPVWAMVMVRVALPADRHAWFSTRYFFRDTAGSPARIEIDRPIRSGDGLFISGRKPFGQRVLLEGSEDLCEWARLAADATPTTDFTFAQPSGPDRRFYRVRRWELMQ
ncbi:MAG: hypothetical protein H7A46_17795 [Verrucomicrobiales bacterium]|nr:hypothetical protein [Verrucomicrobiales bacterium]